MNRIRINRVSATGNTLSISDARYAIWRFTDEIEYRLGKSAGAIQ